MNSSQARLFDALVACQGLQHLLDTGASLLGMPLALCDPYWVVRLASPSIDSLDDVVRINSRGQYHLDPQLISRIESEQPGTAVDLLLASGSRCCRILPVGLDARQPSAWLIALTSASAIRQADSQLLSTFCQALLCELDREGSLSASLRNNDENLLNSLLDGHVIAEFDGVRQPFRPNAECLYFVCVVEAGVNRGLDAAALLDLMDQVDYESMIMREKHPVLLIRTAVLSLEAYLESRSCLARQLECLGLRGGISYPFELIDDFSTHYRQAWRAMSSPLANAECPPLTAYVEIACLDLVAACMAAGRVTNECFHPLLTEIVDYDRAHGTNHYSTLSTLVAASGNVKAGARLLGVRWSTLNNRVIRVRELFGVDLKDNEVIRRLFFACGIENIRRDLVSFKM